MRSWLARFTSSSEDTELVELGGMALNGWMGACAVGGSVEDIVVFIRLFDDC